MRSRLFATTISRRALVDAVEALAKLSDDTVDQICTWMREQLAQGKLTQDEALRFAGAIQIDANTLLDLYHVAYWLLPRIFMEDDSIEAVEVDLTATDMAKPEVAARFRRLYKPLSDLGKVIFEREAQDSGIGQLRAFRCSCDLRAKVRKSFRALYDQIEEYKPSIDALTASVIINIEMRDASGTEAFTFETDPPGLESLITSLQATQKELLELTRIRDRLLGGE